MVEARSGAGSIPACRRISHTLEAAILIPGRAVRRGCGGNPRAGILPCQAKHQQADGADGVRPAWALGTGPGRMAARRQGPVAAQHRLRRTSSRNQPSTSPGNRCSRAARNARSPGQNRGRVAPSCRSPRAGDVAAGSPPPCPGRSPQAAAVTRTRSCHPDRQVEAAQPIITPQAEPLGETSSSGTAKITYSCSHRTDDGTGRAGRRWLGNAAGTGQQLGDCPQPGGGGARRNQGCIRPACERSKLVPERCRTHPS